jgi:hypothetical protein
MFEKEGCKLVLLEEGHVLALNGPRMEAYLNYWPL